MKRKQRGEEKKYQSCFVFKLSSKLATFTYHFSDPLNDDSVYCYMWPLSPWDGRFAFARITQAAATLHRG